MSALSPQTPNPASGDDRNLVTIDENYLAPTLEDRVVMFWEKNGRTVVVVLSLIAIGLIARWGFAEFAAARERAIAADYAAATDSSALQAFAAANPKAALAGAAHLRLADEAYAAGNYTAAAAAYNAAAPLLATQPLGDRARIGAAISLLQAGSTAEARSALETLANDTTFARTLRGESAYHLAVLARDAGQSAEATRWTELVLSVDPSGLWAQRALQLRATIPAVETASAPETATVTEATAASTPAAVSFPAAK